jgi:hypothetical protein
VIDLVWTDDWQTAGEDELNWDIFDAAGLPGPIANFVAFDRDDHMVVNDGSGQFYRTTHPVSMDDPGQDLVLLHRDCKDRATPYKRTIDVQETVEITWQNESGHDIGLYRLNDVDLGYFLEVSIPDGTSVTQTEYDTAKMMALDDTGRCLGFWEMKKDDTLTIEAP